MKGITLLRTKIKRLCTAVKILKGSTFSTRRRLSRETYSRNPINYSEGMADDQKDRYIQYLAEQNQDLRLTSDAMKLVLEDFMDKMKELEEQMASMQSKQSDLENRLSEERKLRQNKIRLA